MEPSHVLMVLSRSIYIPKISCWQSALLYLFCKVITIFKYLNKLIILFSALGGASMALVNCFRRYQNPDQRREQTELEQCKSCKNYIILSIFDSVRRRNIERLERQSRISTDSEADTRGKFSKFKISSKLIPIDIWNRDSWGFQGCYNPAPTFD